MNLKNIIIAFLLLANTFIINSFTVFNKNINTIAVFAQRSNYQLPFYESKYGFDDAQIEEGLPELKNIVYVEPEHQVEFWCNKGFTIWFVDIVEGKIYDTSCKFAAALDLKFYDKQKLADSKTIITVKREKVLVYLGKNAIPRDLLVYKIRDNLKKRVSFEMDNKHV